MKLTLKRTVAFLLLLALSVGFGFGFDGEEKCGCGGCMETCGHPFHGECPVAVCAQGKGLVHCGECSEFPCELLTQYSCDPEHGDKPAGARIDQCKAWKRDCVLGK